MLRPCPRYVDILGLHRRLVELSPELPSALPSALVALLAASLTATLAAARAKSFAKSLAVVRLGLELRLGVERAAPAASTVESSSTFEWRESSLTITCGAV
jgi:hypothetical protein